MRHGLIFAAAILWGLAAADKAGAVTIISDARLTLPEFAAKSGQDPALFESRYAATGMVVCSGVYSTAQLTIKDDVVTTAAHAFYDTDGNPRGDLATCHFNIMIEGKQLAVPLDVTSLHVGSRKPYSVAPVHDWAVVRLAQHVPAAQPYGIGEPGPVGMPIVMLAHRHRGWIHDGLKAIEACAIRVESRVEKLSARELAIDCSAGEGASGSAIMAPGSVRRDGRHLCRLALDASGSSRPVLDDAYEFRRCGRRTVQERHSGAGGRADGRSDQARRARLGGARDRSSLT